MYWNLADWLPEADPVSTWTCLIRERRIPALAPASYGLRDPAGSEI